MTDERLQRLQNMAERCSHNGSVDQITLRQIEALSAGLEPENMTAERIKQIRQKERISQGNWPGENTGGLNHGQNC